MEEGLHRCREVGNDRDRCRPLASVLLRIEHVILAKVPIRGVSERIVIEEWGREDGFVVGFRGAV